MGAAAAAAKLMETVLVLCCDLRELKFLNTKKIGFFVQMGNYYIQQSSEINLVSWLARPNSCLGFEQDL